MDISLVEMYALVRKTKPKNVSETFLVTWVLSNSHIDKTNNNTSKLEIQSIKNPQIIPKARFKFKIATFSSQN